jgi:hypothetical protein
VRSRTGSFDISDIVIRSKRERSRCSSLVSVLSTKSRREEGTETKTPRYSMVENLHKHPGLDIDRALYLNTGRKKLATNLPRP